MESPVGYSKPRCLYAFVLTRDVLVDHKYAWGTRNQSHLANEKFTKTGMFKNDFWGPRGDLRLYFYDSKGKGWESSGNYSKGILWSEEPDMLRITPDGFFEAQFEV